MLPSTEQRPQNAICDEGMKEQLFQEIQNYDFGEEVYVQIVVG